MMQSITPPQRAPADVNSKTNEYQLVNLIRLIGGHMLVYDIDVLIVSRFVAARRTEQVPIAG